MIILIAGLVLFFAIHFVNILAPSWRDQKAAAMGEGPWKGIYSLISFAGLILIIWGYALAWPQAPVLYEAPAALKIVNMILMIPALILIVIFMMGGTWIGAKVKHPMLLAAKLWAFGHLLANGDLASILLFGSFLAYAVIDRISVKRRGVKVPAGPAGWTMRDTIAVIIGLAVYVLFMWRLHLWLFGAVPYPVS